MSFKVSLHSIVQTSLLMPAKVGPGTIIVLQSAKVVKELVDKRSSKYSSRPNLYVVQDLIADHDHPLCATLSHPTLSVTDMSYSHALWQRMAKGITSICSLSARKLNTVILAPKDYALSLLSGKV